MSRLGRLRAAIVSAVVALGGWGSGEEQARASAEAERTTTGAAGASVRNARSGLDGTWTTEPLTLDDMANALRARGLGAWVSGLERNLPVAGGTTRLVLEVRHGRWNLYGDTGGGPPEPIEFDGLVEVDGATAVISHDGYSNIFRWSVDGDALTLTWAATSYPDDRGVPEEVFQTALYMAAGFSRS